MASGCRNNIEKKERALTSKEKLRMEKLEKLTAELSGQGYVRKDQLISILFANIMAFIWVIPFAVLFLAWFADRNGFYRETGMGGSLLFFPVMAVLIVVHELLHGATWAIVSGKGWKPIEFGFILKYVTPYCTCKEPLKKWQYVLGGFAPCLILGIIPSVVAVYTNSFFWLAMGLFMIMAAGGDLTIIMKILLYRPESEDVIILDHPSECGFITFER